MNHTLALCVNIPDVSHLHPVLRTPAAKHMVLDRIRGRFREIRATSIYTTLH